MDTPCKMNKNTSWENVSSWYDKSVGKEGHYYHKHIVLPGLLRILNLNDEKSPSVLDLGCGQGVLSHHLPKKTPYTGVDVATSLITAAKERAPPHCEFITHDLQKPLNLSKKDFSHACIVLALQNMEEPKIVLKNAARHLKACGKLIIILNHPCFRIPRQSSWEIDEKKKWQYRRIDRYMSPLSIPINMHPGQKPDEKTVSFHFPLSYYVNSLNEAGFSVEHMEEWCSDKESSGKKAKMENQSRKEFPLFLALGSVKR